MTYQLAPVWPEPADDIRDEVVRFWSATGALSDAATAQERSRQLLVVVRNAHGHVVGVSTAVRAFQNSWLRQSEVWYSCLQSCQYDYDDASTFGSRCRLADAGCFANLGFASNIAFAAIVRRFDIGMFHEHKQAIWILH